MRVALLCYVIAFAVRVATGLLFPDPAYPDSYYYVAVAHALHEGRGLSVDFIWNFVDVGGRLPADPHLPVPSNAHWMPLASLIQVPFLALLGETAWAWLLPFALVGAASAPLTWAIARDAGLRRERAAAAGLLGAVPGAASPFLSQPDNFGLFMPLGALALWLCARGIRGDRRAFALGGLAVGLATLSRNDGVLLAAPFALAFAWERWRRWRAGAGGATPPRITVQAAVASGLLFLAATGPWYARQLAVFGSLSPSAQSGRILWITTYRELYSVTGETTLGSFLAQGPASLLTSRLEGLAWAAVILAAVPLLLYLAPLALLGAGARRRETTFRPWAVYGATLLAFSGLLFAVHVRYGTFLHSAVALAPHAYVAAIEGVAIVVAWVARRRPHWDPERAARNFALMAVAVAWCGGAIATWRLQGDWRMEADGRRAAAIFLGGVAGAGDRLMSPDAGGYRYYTGLGGVVTPDDPLPTVEAVARAYDVRWLVLERDHLVASLGDVYRGVTPPPRWLTGPLYTLPGTAPPGTGGAGETGSRPALPRLAVYAVCLDPDDARPACRPGASP